MPTIRIPTTLFLLAAHASAHKHGFCTAKVGVRNVVCTTAVRHRVPGEQPRELCLGQLAQCTATPQYRRGIIRVGHQCDDQRKNAASGRTKVERRMAEDSNAVLCPDWFPKAREMLCAKDGGETTLSRAIPYLCGWQVLSKDIICQAPSLRSIKGAIPTIRALAGQARKVERPIQLRE
jgi:hypothetical protein